MPTRITTMSEAMIILTGCFLGTNVTSGIATILSTYFFWLVAYILFMSTRKPIFKIVKDFIYKYFNKETADKCCKNSDNETNTKL